MDVFSTLTLILSFVTLLRVVLCLAEEDVAVVAPSFVMLGFVGEEVTVRCVETSSCFFGWVDGIILIAHSCTVELVVEE